jgi:hypothetical protein
MLILLGGIFGGSLIYSILLLFLTTLARVSGVSLHLHFHFSFSPSTQGDYVSQLDSFLEEEDSSLNFQTG